MFTKFKRKALFGELKNFCHMSQDEGDYIETTLWANGEGFDVVVHTSNRKESFSLTDGEFELLTELVKQL